MAGERRESFWFIVYGLWSLQIKQNLMYLSIHY
jgi:hypothetical protein